MRVRTIYALKCIQADGLAKVRPKSFKTGRTSDDGRTRAGTRAMGAGPCDG